MWFNFHTHSSYCDGKGELSNFIDQAIQLELCSLGFSSHAPLPFNCGWSMRSHSLSEYLEEVKNLKQSNSGIEIYTGLEVDYIPGFITPAQFKHQLDYVIGSIHFVEKFPDGTPWEVDGSHTNFLHGLEKIFNGNVQEVVCRYFQLMREMIITSSPDIIGHLDKLKIQNSHTKFFSEEVPWYRDEIIKTIGVIKDAGVIVEVNTRGLYLGKSSTTYPSPWILEILCQKSIPITINSDAHHPGDLINKFRTTAAMLKEIGFKKITVLREGKWKGFNYRADGIKIS